MELYQITYNEDDNDGGVYKVFMNLYFTEKSSAKTYIESKYYADTYGMQGYKCNDYYIRTVKKEDIEPKIYSSISDYQEKSGINIDLTNKQNKEKELENMTKKELIDYKNKRIKIMNNGIKIKQLGNGGAFDFDKTNSSFLIESDKDTYFLFDCGYSVYAELRRQDSSNEIDLNKLKYIYISHMDDDHMGSLKTLIYYMYFILKKRVMIIAVKEVFTALKSYLSDIDGYVENCIKIEDSLFNTRELKLEKLKLDSFIISPVETYHFKPCYGLEFRYETDELVYFFISGDTKANDNFQKMLDWDVLAFGFHDFSHWDNFEQQVHCCEYDFDKTYIHSSNKIIKYHTGDDFDGSWRSLSEIIESLPKER
jgi:hypothetical protein